MPHYKALDGSIHFLSDRKHEKHLPHGCVEIPDDEAQAIARATASVPIPLPDQAAHAMEKTRVTLERCFENDIKLPQAWSQYRKALRAIINGTDTVSTTLPVRPDYPPGT